MSAVEEETAGEAETGGSAGEAGEVVADGSPTNDEHDTSAEATEEAPLTFATPEEEMAYWKAELSRINDAHSCASSKNNNNSNNNNAATAGEGGGGGAGDGDDNMQQMHVPFRAVDRGDNEFLHTVPEAAQTNQYWYSASTITVLATEASEQAGETGRIGCVSTPSIFFSLPPVARARSVLFDFDESFASKVGDANDDDDEGDGGDHNHNTGSGGAFTRYDFNDDPEDGGLPAAHRHAFDVLVIDPPFITEEVWVKYAATARFLLAPGGKVICTTISENAELMMRLLGVKSQVFRPSIPNLVYQYVATTTSPTAAGRFFCGGCCRGGCWRWIRLSSSDVV